MPYKFAYLLSLWLVVNAINLCQLDSELCLGNLGIERKFMPQLDADKFASKNQCAPLTISTFKITQNEIEERIIKSILSNTTYNPCLDPIIISYNHYIVDGHHRAVSCKFRAETNRQCFLLKSFKCGKDIYQLLFDRHSSPDVGAFIGQNLTVNG